MDISNTSKEYWYDRCRSVERRNDQLVVELMRLRGHKPLSAGYIDAYNAAVQGSENAGPQAIQKTPA